MKKVLAGILAVMLTFSAAALPNDFIGKNAGVLTASASSGVTWSSGTVQASSVNGNLIIQNGLDLNGKTLTVNGDMFVESGKLNIGSGKLVVTGTLWFGENDYSTLGYLCMQNSSGSITTGGLYWKLNSKIDGNYTMTANQITAGTITVSTALNDTTPKGNYNSFQMTGTSKLVLSGQNTVLKGALATILNTVTYTGSGTPTFNEYINITQPLTQNLNFKASSSTKIKYLDLNGKTVNVTGSITQVNSDGIAPADAIVFNGGTLNVSQNYTVSSGVIDMSGKGGTLDVKGNLVLALGTSTAGYTGGVTGIKMTATNDVVKVGGNLVINNLSTSKYSSTFSGGTLYVAGNFDCANGKVSFSKPHKTILNGTKAQTISIPSSAKFYDLELKQATSQYTPSDYTTLKNMVAGTLTTQGISISGATVSASAQTYTGSELKPTPTVTFGGTKLTAGTDFKVKSYSDNINAGTAKVVVEGIGQYNGTASGTFTINKASISGATVTASAQTYTGSALKPAVTVKLGSKTLTSSDYDVSYSNNTAVGTANITITGKGNYSGTATGSFKINGISISGATVSASAQTYTGSELRPAPTVTLNGKTLTSGTDYTVAYSNNVNAGSSAAITITGKGNYSGTASGKFTINAKSISGVTVSPDSFEYDGTAKTPAVKDGSKTLTSGTDYEITSISGNTEPGTAKISIKGKGNYTGTATKEFTIKAKSASNFSLAVDSYIYDGTAKKPGIKDGSTALVENTDYTVTYSSNTNAGTAKAVVKGKGRYTGETTLYFTIQPKSAEGLTVSLSADNYTYDGSEKKPTVTVKDPDLNKTLTSGTDYTVSYTDNKNVGNATVNITFKGNYTGSKSAGFTISKASAKPISDCTVTLSSKSFTYDGSEKKPSVTVKNSSGTVLTEGSDYTVSYDNNINAGEATVTVTGAGDRYSGTNTVKFTIAAKDISSCYFAVSPDVFDYDGSAKTPSPTVRDDGVELMAETDYTITYSNNVKVGEATATIKGQGNYKGTNTAKFVINEKRANAIDINSCTVSKLSDVTYSGSAFEPAVTIKNGSVTLKAGTDYSVSYNENVNAGTASVNITGMNAYTGTINLSFEIKPADMSGASVSVSPNSFTYDGEEKTPAVTVKVGSAVLTEGVDFTVEYKNNKAEGKATATATGMGNYTGSKSVNFTITSGKTDPEPEPKPSTIDISDFEISLSANEFEYDGTAKTPVVTVKDGSGKQLTEGTDFTVSMGGNVEVGTVNVTANGIGSYTGSVSTEFSIVQKAFADLEFLIVPESVEYTGQPQRPRVTVKDGEGKGLTENTDYTVEYADNTKAGTATITITGKGNYSGVTTKEFEITKSDISNATMTLSNYSYTADGSEKTPQVTIEKGERTLVEGVDFEVAYYDNVAMGKATVTATGLGNYKGTLSQPFAISSSDATSIEGMTVTLSQDSFAYDGTAQVPEVIVGNGSYTLMEGTDYELAFTNNVDVGTVTITVIGCGYYKDTITAEYKIVGQTIEDAEISAAADSFDYDGEPKTPAIIVMLDGEQLTEGVDFEVEYSNNVDAGTAKAVVKGIGNYSGELETTFTINGRSADNMVIELEFGEVEFDGEAVTPKVTVTDNGRELTEGVDYKVIYEDNDKVGTATVRVVGMGSYVGEITDTFVITEKSSDSGNDGSKDGSGDDGKKGQDNDPDSGNGDGNDNDPDGSGLLLGDVNGDGIINVTDIAKIAAHVKAVKSMDDDKLAVADVNGDGVVNVTDLSRVAAHVKGIKEIGK